MTFISHLKCSTKFEEIQATRFEEVFDVDLHKIEQGIGVTGDYKITRSHSCENRWYEKIRNSPIVEFKHDKASTKTNNLYLEFAQTLDGFFTTHSSGCDLAIKNGNLLVITTGTQCLVFDEPHYQKLLEYVTRDVQTKNWSNGNPAGSFTKGHLVSVRNAEICCLLKYDMLIG